MSDDLKESEIPVERNWIGLSRTEHTDFMSDSNECDVCFVVDIDTGCSACDRF